MALEQLSLLTGLNKIETAITILQAWEPPEGYYFADSGGKDSSAARHLLYKANVKFDAHYCVSPIDPKPIHDFLKQHHPETQWDYHARGFWKMVVDKGLPMRNARWCCQVIKEAGGQDRVVVVGNRRVEGNIRKNQCFIETPQHRNSKGHRKSTKTFIRPIIDWDNYDIWQYLRENNISYCYLYDEGATLKSYGKGVFKRLGCVLCPFSRNIEREELYFPKITNLWKVACDKIVEATKDRNYITKTGKPVKNKFTTGEELYQWWTKRDRKHPSPDSIPF